mgnify:CR=1 FL=1
MDHLLKKMLKVKKARGKKEYEKIPRTPVERIASLRGVTEKQAREFYIQVVNAIDGVVPSAMNVAKCIEKHPYARDDPHEIALLLKQSALEPIPEPRKFVLAPREERMIKESLRHQPRKNSQTRPKPIILRSKRGTKLKSGRCSECHRSRKPVWYYPKSNRGGVRLCSACKQLVFERSSSREVDLLDVALSGGAFETSTRRH